MDELFENRKKETRDNEFFPALMNANEVLKEALKLDEAEDFQNALQKYTDASQILIDILKNETDEKKKNGIRYQIYEVLNRAEEIKRIMDENKEGSNENDFDVILKIERIRCYRVRRCIGIREIIAEEDPLYILKSKDKVDNVVIVSIGPLNYQFNENIPCLRMGRGFYVFPGVDDVYYSIIFPRAIHDTFITLFESKLSPYCTFKSSDNEVPDDIIKTIEDEEKSINDLKLDDFVEVENTNVMQIEKEKEGLSLGISKTIQVGGDIISNSIKFGGELISKGIQKGEEFISSHISTTQDTHVNDTVKGGFRVIKDVSSTTVKISEKIISGIAIVATTVGSKIGEEFNKYTSKVVREGKESPFTSGIKEVGSVSLLTVISVWKELEGAGSTIISQTGNSTTNLLEKNMEKKWEIYLEIHSKLE